MENCIMQMEFRFWGVFVLLHDLHNCFCKSNQVLKQRQYMQIHNTIFFSEFPHGMWLFFIDKKKGLNRDIVVSP